MQTQRLQARGRGPDEQNVGKSNPRVWRTLAAAVIFGFLFFFFNICLLITAVPGLSCSAWDLQSCGMQDLFLFVACEIFRGIWNLVP